MKLTMELAWSIVPLTKTSDQELQVAPVDVFVDWKGSRTIALAGVNLQLQTSGTVKLSVSMFNFARLHKSFHLKDRGKSP